LDEEKRNQNGKKIKNMGQGNAEIANHGDHNTWCLDDDRDDDVVVVVAFALFVV